MKTNKRQFGPLQWGWAFHGPQVHLLAFWRDKLVLYRVTDTPRTRWHKLVHAVKFVAQFAQVWPVYFVEWSRDCDLCEATYAHRFPTYWHAHQYMKHAFENAEGPKSFDQVTRKQYEEFKPTFRDRVLEAFEDGRGTHTII